MKGLHFLIASLSLICSGFANAQSRNLNDYIELAKQNSPLIKGYQNQILQNQLDSLLLKASLRPQVNFLSTDLYAPVIKGWGYDEAITNGAQLSGLVQASRNFLSKGNLAAQYRAIGLHSLSLLDTIRLTQKELVRTITEQYITAYADQLTYNYTKQLYDLLKDEENALKKLAESSVIKQTDFLAFDITLQQQQLNYLQAQIQYAGDYLTLNYLSGIVDTSISALPEPGLMDSLPHDFNSSVFYKRYVTDSLRIENERRLIAFSYRPTIGTYADAGYYSSLHFLPYRNFGYSFGLNLKVPIYDGHQRRLKYQKLDLQESTRVANRNFFMNQYNQQIAQLNFQLHATDDLFQKLQKQIEYTRTLIVAYGKLLQTGDVKVTDFVTAITNYLNSQNAYRQNLISRLRIMNQINYYNQ
ncbi:MAG TPA: TolC family protein [Flavisolibacter sp.]|nr:TolC family protein [Flavisolibacter sp.]